MEELSMLLGLGQMGMSGMQNASNTALGSIPLALSVADRFRARMDPDMRRYGEILRGRYNDSAAQNPYGDIYSGWGGMFGQHDDGSNIGAGEGQARAIQQMMGQNPMGPTLQNYQQLAQMQRPAMADTTAGLSSLMGHPSQFANNGGYVQPTMAPASINAQAATNTNFSGAPGSTARDNTIRTDKPLDPYIAASTESGARPAGGGMGGMLGGGQGGQGGRGGWIMPMLQRGIQNRGGMGALLGQMRGPGSAMDNIGDFIRGGQQHGIPQQGGGGFGLRKSYAVGTGFVPQTGRTTVHQGEAIIPRHMNPNAHMGMGGVQPAPGVTPGAPMASTGGNMSAPPASQNIRLPNAGGASQGMSGGPATPTTPAAQPPNVMQQLLGSPQALGQEQQNQIIGQGTDWLQNQYGGMLRNQYAQSAQTGRPVNTADNAFGLTNQVGDLRRNTAVDAARTNWQNMYQTAGLQLQGENSLANQQLAQQQMNQGMWNQDYSNMARVIDSMYGVSQNGMNQQGNWWNQLTGLGNAGAHFSDPFLQSAIQNSMWSIQPSQIAQAPQVGGSNPAGVGLDAVQGWQSLWGS